MSARNVAILASALTLTACSDLQEYPADWPAPKATLTNNCSDLAGKYSNIDSSGSLIDLVHILRGYDRDKKITADSIELTVPANGTLIIEAFKNGKVISEFKYSSDLQTLSCNSNEAWLTISDGAIASQGVLGYSKIRASLGTDKDGYLILRREESSVGAYGVIPVAGNSRRWYRFKPTTESGIHKDQE